MEMIKEGIYKSSYATFFMTKNILDTIEEGVFEQAKNASMIPDVEFLGYTPDAHIGKGTSIGTIIVWDMGKAWISPTIVGVDIGCGMRLIKTDYYADNLDKQTLRKLMNEVEKMIPTGVGKKNKKLGLTKTQYEKILFDFEVDKEISDCMDMFIEYNIDSVPQEAYEVGIEQFATLGGGNHFIEFQKLSLIDKEIGQKWGLFEGQLVIMVHSGSRRLGSLIGDFYQKKFQKIMGDKNISTPDKNLTFLPIDNKVAKEYIKAMQVAFIYAKLNRHFMSNFILEILEKNNINGSVLYDVSHNIAYKEKFNNNEKLIIRKGATRAFPSGHYLNSQCFAETGHPVILPGSMGSFSYILRGIESNKISYHTVNHGAGRVISRNQARKSISIEDFSKALNQGNKGEILINTRNLKDFIDESPQSYKDINLVIESVITSGLAQVVAKLTPLGVIKGKD